MSKNRFNGQVNKKATNNAPKKEHTSEKKKYEPKYTSEQYDLADLVKSQIDQFLESQKNIDTMSYEDRRAAEDALFSLSDYPAVLACCSPDYKAYMVNRSVRVDFETHLLTRASCTMILIDQETAEPVYLVEAFVNTNGGAISVVPQGDIGPILRDTYRVSLHRD